MPGVVNMVLVVMIKSTESDTICSVYVKQVESRIPVSLLMAIMATWYIPLSSTSTVTGVWRSML